VVLAGGALPVLGLPGSRLHAHAAEAGLPVVAEAFADRAYTGQATLVPRTQDGAVISDGAAVVKRAVRMATEGTVIALTGEQVDVPARSLCLHGDTAGAVELARTVREALEEAGVSVEPFA
jgi:UPF0271 protein